MNREEGYGFVVAVLSPENIRDPPTVHVHYEIENDVHLHDPLRDVTIADYWEIFSKVSRKGGSYLEEQSKRLTDYRRMLHVHTTGASITQRQ
eukprot:scaffold10225_cov232-Chaetoceros_neogracile.AAC.1